LVVDDEWPSAIQACKGDGKKGRLDQDKKQGLKAKKGRFVFGSRNGNFGWKVELARIYSCCVVFPLCQ
jgi:hypothetical protein